MDLHLLVYSGYANRFIEPDIASIDAILHLLICPHNQASVSFLSFKLIPQFRSHHVQEAFTCLVTPHILKK